MTTAQKEEKINQRNTEEREAKRKNQERTIAALEKIIQDVESSREAKENAVFLLARIYGQGGWALYTQYMSAVELL